MTKATGNLTRLSVATKSPPQRFAMKGRAEKDQPRSPAPPKHAKTTNKHSVASRDGIQPFRLLDLPPELRNTIYACVMAQEPQGLLIPANPGKLFCKAALARTSRQVRAEFITLLHIAFTGVVAEVRNFNFGHVITWLNWLEETDLQALPTTKNTEHRPFTMTIKLTITENPLKSKGHEHLARWLNRLEHPKKNGADVVVNYEVDPFRSVKDVERTANHQIMLYNRLNGNFKGRKGEAIAGMIAACKAHWQKAKGWRR